MRGLVSSFFLSLVCHCVSAHAFINDLEVDDVRQQELQQIVENNRRSTQRHFSRHHWGIEIITAGGTWAQVESIFGHSLIRLLDDDDDPSNDTVIGFEMLPIDSARVTRRGLLGGYAILPVVRDFSTYLVEYSLLQSRSTVRVILPSTEEIVQRLKSVVQRTLDVPLLVGDYRFFGNNCATALLKLLGAVGYPTPWTVLDIPAQLPSRFQSALMTYAPSIELPVMTQKIWDFVCLYLQTEKGVGYCSLHWWKEKAAEWKAPFKDVVKPVLAQEGFWQFLSRTASGFDKSVLAQLWPLEWQSSDTPGRQDGDLYLRVLQFRMAETAALEEWPLQRLIASYPRELYRICALSDRECRDARLRTALRIWPKSDLVTASENFAAYRTQELKRAKQLVPRGRLPIERWLNSDIVQDMAAWSEELK